jgi:tyrosyl-tRNA synthetase
MQIGGQDQWGNITSGLELIRKIHGADAKAYGMTFPLVTKEDGTKFGKTEEGAVWLDPKRTSPYAFYQFWLNTSDADAIDRLKQFTFLTKKEIESIAAAFKEAPHERLAQKTLARELTAMVHGGDALEQAEKITDALFSGDIRSLSSDDIAMGFSDLPSMDVDDDIQLDAALLNTGLVSSKREAREMIKNNAVAVNGEKITDTYHTIEKEDAIDGLFTVIRKGKKRYALIRHRG